MLLATCVTTSLSAVLLVHIMTYTHREINELDYTFTICCYNYMIIANVVAIIINEILLLLSHLMCKEIKCTLCLYKSAGPSLFIHM